MVTITSRVPARPVASLPAQVLRAAVSFYLEVLPGRFGWPLTAVLYVVCALFGVAGLALGSVL